MQTTITLKCLAVVLLTYVSQFRKIQFSKILKIFEATEVYHQYTYALCFFNETRYLIYLFLICKDSCKQLKLEKKDLKRVYARS